MKAIELLASSLGRNDDLPNQQLADEIIKGKKSDWVNELVEHLNHKDKSIQSDCIKVLYEIGERGAPELIAPYCTAFVQLLKSKNNRLVWGAMLALDMITPLKPKEINDHLPFIMEAIDKGSTITIDHGVGILAKLTAQQKYSSIAEPLLLEQLTRCPFKQLPMYLEKSVIAINPSNKAKFMKLIESRYRELDKDSQKKRVNKIVSKMQKM